MNPDRRTSMIEALKDKEYRDLYIESHITEGLALQIRALREDRLWTQSQLGEQADFKQEAISRLEDPDYGKYSLSTLRRLASAFDVALVVRFAAFSELVDWTVNLTPGRLSPPDFAHDGLLHHERRNILALNEAAGWIRQPLHAETHTTPAARVATGTTDYLARAV